MRPKKYLMFIFALFFLRFNQCSTKTNETNILLLGNTGSGRSCFVNNFFNNHLAEVGEVNKRTGIYIPKTMSTGFYRGTRKDENKKLANFTLIDTKGFSNNDTSEKDKIEKFENIYQESINNLHQIDFIFLFFSLSDDKENDLVLILDMINLIFRKKLNTTTRIIILSIKRKRLLKDKKSLLMNISNSYNVSYFHISTYCDEPLIDTDINEIFKNFNKNELKLQDLSIQIETTELHPNQIEAEIQDSIFQNGTKELNPDKTISQFDKIDQYDLSIAAKINNSRKFILFTIILILISIVAVSLEKFKTANKEVETIGNSFEVNKKQTSVRNIGDSEVKDLSNKNYESKSCKDFICIDESNEIYMEEAEVCEGYNEPDDQIKQDENFTYYNPTPNNS